LIKTQINEAKFYTFRLIIDQSELISVTLFTITTLAIQRRAEKISDC
jgi:hypothetical protein